MSTKLAKKILSRGRKVEEDEPTFLSTGSTLANLACTNRPFRGYATGSYVLVPGDSNSGKTWMMMTALAEASINPAFDDYRLIYDATTEDGAQMDVVRYFGKRLKDRLEVIRSETAEQFYYNLDTIAKEGKPFIYMCDSENGLGSDQAEDKFEEKKKAFEKGKETTGSYGDGKAKIHSDNLRRVCAMLKKTRSILFIASQSRDNIGAGPYGDPRTRSGGRALKFYAMLEFWTSVKEEIKTLVRDKQRQIGISVAIKVKKSRWTGKSRTVFLDIYHSTGIDDVGANIDYLLEEGHWKKNSGVIKAKEFDFTGKVKELIKHIEETGQEKKLARLVAEVWNDIENECTVERKNKYQ